MQTTYPSWMNLAVRIENERRAEIAEKERIERERVAQEDRRLGALLPEALAFFGIAVPALPTNRAVCDFVAFRLDPHVYEPVKYDEAGEPALYDFRLIVGPLRGFQELPAKNVFVYCRPDQADKVRDAHAEFSQVVMAFHRQAALFDLARERTANCLKDDPQGEIELALLTMKDAREPGATPREFAAQTSIGALYEWAMAEELYTAAALIEKALDRMLTQDQLAEFAA